MNRRKFSRQISLGTGGLALLSPLSASCSPKTRSKESLGVALVGLGSYSTYQLAPALEETQHCHLAAVVTGSPEKAKRWTRQYKLNPNSVYDYENFHQIAQNSEVDIVYIVLPNSMHAEFSIRAARARKHVICEKPMGLSSEECVSIIDACKKAGVKLGMGYRLHSEPYTMELKRLVKQKKYGQARYISSTAAYVSRGNPNQWRLDKSLSGGGALMNMGVYAFQALIYAAGSNPTSVSAQEYSTRPEYFKETDETITAQFEWANGALGQMMTSHNYRSNHLRAEYEKGWVELSPASTYIPLSGKTSDGPLDFKQESQQKLQMDDFALHIQGQQPNRAPGEMGHRDLLIIEAIYRSIREGGKKIKLNIAPDYGRSPLF